MMSCFHTMGPIGGWMGMALCTSSLVAASGVQVQSAVVGRPASSQAILLTRWPRTCNFAWTIALQSTRGPSKCYQSCHKAVAMWRLVFRRSLPYRREDSLLQHLVQFKRMWHRGQVKVCYLLTRWLPDWLYTQPFYSHLEFCPGLSGWTGTRKVKPIWIYWSKR